MNEVKNDHRQRELWLTPAVLKFMETGANSPDAKELNYDILRSIDGRDEMDNSTLMSAAPTFLIRILAPLDAGGPERVLVWHGPSDGGPFYNPAIFEKALPYGIGLD